MKSAGCAVDYNGRAEPGRHRSQGQEVCHLPAPYMVHTRIDNTQYEGHAQAAPQRPSTWYARKTTHATQTQDMMEQEHQDDDARGEPATPSTPTTTTTREGRQRPADPDDLGSPSNRSREHAPGALSPSPTHAVYSAHQGPTTQLHTGHYPCTTNTTGP